jgi:hypothetical protein
VGLLSPGYLLVSLILLFLYCKYNIIVAHPTLHVEVGGCSETLVHVYQAILSQIPVDSNVNCHLRTSFVAVQ